MGSMDFSAMGNPPSFDGNMPDFGSGEKGGFDFAGFGMGSDDVKLKYTDDNPESYSNIFNSAKTVVSNADKTRLINALRQLSEGNVESCVDTDSVITYMAVHNFLDNDDSYTGSMVHNYYLLEQDGILSMIPWDYNLGFGTFTGGAGTSSVNTPIADIAASDRAMATWIMNDDTYMAEYLEAYAKFIEECFDSGWFTEELNRVVNMIDSYILRETSSFYTHDEFTAGVEVLKQYVDRRVQSVKGQLDGSIPSTSAAQSGSDALIDASDLNLTELGAMNTGGGDKGGFGGMNMPGFDASGTDKPSADGSGQTAPDASAGTVPAGTDTSVPSMPTGDAANQGTMPAGFDASQIPAGTDFSASSGASAANSSGASAAATAVPSATATAPTGEAPNAGTMPAGFDASQIPAGTDFSASSGASAAALTDAVSSATAAAAATEAPSVTVASETADAAKAPAASEQPAEGGDRTHGERPSSNGGFSMPGGFSDGAAQSVNYKDAIVPGIISVVFLIFGLVFAKRWTKRS